MYKNMGKCNFSGFLEAFQVFLHNKEGFYCRNWYSYFYIVKHVSEAVKI